MKDTSKTIASILGQVVPLLTVLAVITPIVMSDGLFFPYITGKAFYFRILVEALAFLYCLYALVDKNVRPKLSSIYISAGALIVLLGISTLVAVDPLKSFWSNYERMEGYILFLHLGAYLLVASSVIKFKSSWWNIFFTSSMVMSLIVGLDAMLDPLAIKGGINYRIFGNLGNSSYLGVYSLVHIFMALYFIIARIGHKDLRTLNKEGAWLSIGFYSIVAIFNTWIMYNTGTRGSFVGLVAGIFVSSLIIAIFEKRNRLIKQLGLGLVIASVLFVGVLGVAKNSSFVKNSNMLNRFAEIVTLDFKGVLNNQGKARSVLWGMAWDGVKERPVFGWGLDNFQYVFAKHYDPEMYSQEQWFDRSHNVFMDWLTQAGFAGLLAYLSLFGTSVYVLYKRRDDESDLPFACKAIITGGFVAYLGHNLFVFDNLASYVLFFSVLAFIHSYGVHNKDTSNKDHKDQKLGTHNSKKNENEGGVDELKLTVAAIILILIGVWVLNSAVIKPYRANLQIIESIKTQEVDSKTGKAVSVTAKEKFEHLMKSIEIDTMTNTEQYEQLVDRVAEVLASNESAEYKAQAQAYLAEQYNKSFVRTPLDPRPRFFYAMYQSRVGAFNEAVKQMEQAVALSPNKQSFLTYYAALLNQTGQNAKALEVSEKAYELEKNNNEAKLSYAAMLIRNNRAHDAEALFQTDKQDEMMSYLTNNSIISAYVESKQISRIIELVQKQISLAPQYLDLRSVLASIYIKTGNIAQGIKELEMIKTLAPQYAENIDALIKQVKTENNIK